MRLLTMMLAAVLGLALIASAAEPAHPGAAGEAGHEAADAHAAGGGEHAEPQLLPPPGPAQVITAATTLLIFIILLAVLGKFAWGPIVAGLRQREEKIRRDIADAEAARARAEQTLREYTERLQGAENRIREMMAKAQADADRAAAGIRARGQEEAEAAKERALREIDTAREQAVGEVYQQAATLSTSIAEKILRRELRPEDQRDLVNRSLEQLQAAKAN
jgi:F-type H+-transporting ATPase subunit b